MVVGWIIRWGYNYYPVISGSLSIDKLGNHVLAKKKRKTGEDLMNPLRKKLDPRSLSQMFHGIYTDIWRQNWVMDGLNAGSHIPAPWFASGNVCMLRLPTSPSLRLLKTISRRIQHFLRPEYSKGKSQNL